MLLKATKPISSQSINAIADRKLEQWAINRLHDGDDLGLPHMSPEQKLVSASGGYEPDYSNEEKLIMSYMATLENRDPLANKVARLHYMEREWWRGAVRKRGYWLRSEKGRRPEQAPDKVYPVRLLYVEKQRWLKGFKPYKAIRRPGRLNLWPSEPILTLGPKNKDWLEYVQSCYSINQSDYYERLGKLRRTIYHMTR